MIKVKVLRRCEHCKGVAYLPSHETFDSNGEKQMQYLACPKCHGSGMFGRWIKLSEFAKLLEQSKCRHEYATRTGGYHHSNGDVWDDIQTICDDCGMVLD